jgi:hypothetical protein
MNDEIDFIKRNNMEFTKLKSIKNHRHEISVQEKVEGEW